MSQICWNKATFGVWQLSNVIVSDGNKKSCYAYITKQDTVL